VSPSESAPAPNPGPPHLGFDFDCSGLAPASAARCPAPRSELSTLLGAVNTYRVSAVPTWSAELKAAPAALAAVAKLNPAELSPIERAALQNAALLLLSVATAREKADPSAPAVVDLARALVKRFALSQTEAAALPAADAAVSPWLGDGAAWQHGVSQRLLHTGADAFARAHTQLTNAGAFADVVRLVLVAQNGVPYVSNVVERVVLRRMVDQSVRVCIAELALGCTTPGTLEAIDLARGHDTVAVPQDSIPCMGCHGNNKPGSRSFSTETGFAFADTKAADRIKLTLGAVLKPSAK
jgi:hypothetical protein